ncbi:MAG: endolytic transglycosylase MltG [Burkholderiaceae bacterium]|nr:endolytic transglycosylase MltG [Rhodoferax sp.]MCP5285483.1 endolytic transglycosylase MltG [Burkholderiaceae bacterium]
MGRRVSWIRRTAWALGLGLLLLLLSAAAAAWWAWRWLDQPLPLRTPVVELSVEPGTAPRAVADAWVRAGVDTDARLLFAWFRLSGQAARIRAGSYEIETGTTPRGLLDMLLQGREALLSLRLPEGATLREWRRVLAAAPDLTPASVALSDAALLAAVGAPADGPRWAEGRFFPDTYAYSRRVSDITVLKRAFAAMQRHLQAAWAARAPGLPLKTPEDALILASIIEKETGRADERALVAAVFINRLRIGMPLQTDPTIIYGLGEAFDGNLRKRDLTTDGPYNTYLRGGLPPSPIAMPSLASIQAALNPAASKALYFVARGDGSSQFSETLDAHNRAVNQFQRGGR